MVVENKKQKADANKDIKRQEAEFAVRQKEQNQRTRIDGLLRLYQDAGAIEKIEVSTLAVNIKNDVIKRLSAMVNIVEKDSWYSIHPHDAFPNIDIRMLAYECPASVECPFLLAILRKIGMQRSDYVNYRKRAGHMIAIEHGRKMGKKR